MRAQWEMGRVDRESKADERSFPFFLPPFSFFFFSPERLITRFLTETLFHFEARYVIMPSRGTKDMRQFLLAPPGIPFNLCLLFCKEGLISDGHRSNET